VIRGERVGSPNLVVGRFSMRILPDSRPSDYFKDSSRIDCAQIVREMPAGLPNSHGNLMQLDINTHRVGLLNSKSHQ
jgi:hypothetical protein